MLAFIGATPDSSTILVLNKFSPTDEDSFSLCLTEGLFPRLNIELGKSD